MKQLHYLMKTTGSLGLNMTLNIRNNWIPLITGASFKDSLENTSNYLGGGTKRRFLLGDDPEGSNLPDRTIKAGSGSYSGNKIVTSRSINAY